MIATNGVAKVVSLRCNPNDDASFFREYRGKVYYDNAGIPVVLELRCKNRECCPRVADHFAVHLFTLYGVQVTDDGTEVPVGSYVTRQVKFGDVGNLALGARVASVPANGRV